MTEHHSPFYHQLVNLYGPEKAQQILKNIREGRPIEMGLSAIIDQAKLSNPGRPYDKPLSPQKDLTRPQNIYFSRKPMKRRYPSS